MKKNALSLVEIMVGLLIVSVVLVCVTPLMTRKQKAAPAGVSGNVPVGTIVMYLGQTPPDGWLLCDGKTFSVLEYPKLKDHLGDNKTPDLRGYVPRGATEEDIENKNKE